uniref:Mitochondrial carrier protein n=1 Tax=Chromera velia CCMP2878 TaxID=1169474 RepID=A0A0G4HIR1_9ALVE|eukprot:Cvel_6981.t1-p1 / transcript=Cvel_6981.t1 / gene=Cvel_6981 / organism=Chromera_velia_CCMP2878 / gene_product=Mitochondrial coenzyme A transporter SLC25A42, putative / transcript_product=Mitochondrial coenzyme A transporter SLC25A42, putative / location=Cvel_scaffold354:68128-72052(-) / protein_length=386 / sequence_SO=supercontig / SO=protein_coding / is_pseudo=false
MTGAGGEEEDDPPIVCSVQQTVPLNILKFLSGSAAGVTAKSLVYPLDRLKMIYQVKGSSLGPFRLRDVAPQLYRIARTEGILNLWKGNLAGVGRTIPHAGIVFYCFDTYSALLQKAVPALEHSPASLRILSGGFAGMTSAVVTYPLDLWNTRMAVSRSVTSYSKVTLLRQEGAVSLTRGLLPTVAGIFPYAGISFFTFETLKEWAEHFYGKNSNSKEGGKVHLSPYVHMMCGGVAGLVSQTATYPIDTIRKRMQTSTFLAAYAEAESKFLHEAHQKDHEAHQRAHPSSPGTSHGGHETRQSPRGEMAVNTAGARQAASRAGGGPTLQEKMVQAAAASAARMTGGKHDPRWLSAVHLGVWQTAKDSEYSVFHRIHRISFPYQHMLEG